MKMHVFDSREEWLEGRRSFLGSSDISAILGHGYSNQSAYGVWASKVKGVDPEFDAATKQRLEIGNFTEQITLHLFELYSGVEQTLVAAGTDDFVIRASDTHPFLGVTLDAWLEDPDTVVEAKFVSMPMKHEWANDEMPLKHQIQVQSQLAATGWDLGYLVGWDGYSLPMIRLVPRNDAFIDAMLDTLGEWWERHVIEGIEPEIDGSSATSRTLQLLHPLDNGQTVVLPDDFGDLVARRERAKNEIHNLELVAQQAENRIKAHLAGNTFGVFPDGTAVSWKHINRSAYTVQEKTYRRLCFHKQLPTNASKEFKSK